jgi:hypothetical protein
MKTLKCCREGLGIEAMPMRTGMVWGVQAIQGWSDGKGEYHHCSFSLTDQLNTPRLRYQTSNVHRQFPSAITPSPTQFLWDRLRRENHHWRGVTVLIPIRCHDPHPSLASDPLTFLHPLPSSSYPHLSLLHTKPSIHPVLHVLHMTSPVPQSGNIPAIIC